ncbi:MAG: NIPSNAP family protein [Candidatus Saccharimonas sp.]|nr:NIPSNAP family protein [Planctomycetaceae bacterium]
MPSIRPWLITAAALLVGLAVGWSTATLRAEPDKPAAKVYELRTYTTEEGRLPALHARFRDHTIKLFEKHGMKNVVYFTPIDKDGKPVENKLVYLLAHKSQEARTASFGAFARDPEWIAARDASEKDGRIVANVDSQLFVPTDYSPMK